jgi:catechol 2,3-dioxygenase-like lactoylglutathione lyase family enzyme
MSNAITRGIHHLGVTVPDIHETADFLKNHLHFTDCGGDPGYPAVFVTDGVVMLTIWQAGDPAQCRPFDRVNNIGLHHFALGVPDKNALNALHKTLSSMPDIDIEFSPESLGNTDIQHMMCSIPGGLRVEFIAA